MDLVTLAQGLIDRLLEEAQKAETVSRQHVYRAEGVKLLFDSIAASSGESKELAPADAVTPATE